MDLFFLSLILSCYCEIDTNELDLNDVSNLLSDLDISESDISNHNDVKPQSSRSYRQRYFTLRSTSQKYKPRGDSNRRLQENYSNDKRTYSSYNKKPVRDKSRQGMRQHNRYRPEEVKNILDPGIERSSTNYNQDSNSNYKQSYNSGSQSNKSNFLNFNIIINGIQLSKVEM